MTFFYENPNKLPLNIATKNDNITKTTAITANVTNNLFANFLYCILSLIVFPDLADSFPYIHPTADPIIMAKIDIVKNVDIKSCLSSLSAKLINQSTIQTLSNEIAPSNQYFLFIKF